MKQSEKTSVEDLLPTDIEMEHEPPVSGLASGKMLLLIFALCFLPIAGFFAGVQYMNFSVVPERILKANFSINETKLGLENEILEFQEQILDLKSKTSYFDGVSYINGASSTYAFVYTRFNSGELETSVYKLSHRNQELGFGSGVLSLVSDRLTQEVDGYLIPLEISPDEMMFRVYVSRCWGCAFDDSVQYVLQLTDRYVPTSDVSSAVAIGYAGILEWTGTSTFRYKPWPDESHPEYVYTYTDRETGELCGEGAFGCSVDNVDWDTIDWVEVDFEDYDNS